MASFHPKSRKWTKTEKNSNYKERKVNTLMQWINVFVRNELHDTTGSEHLQCRFRWSCHWLRSHNFSSNLIETRLMLASRELENCIKFWNSRVCCYDGCLFVSSLIFFCIIKSTRYKRTLFIFSLDWMGTSVAGKSGEWEKNTSETLFPKRNVLFQIPIIALKCTHRRKKAYPRMGIVRAVKYMWHICIVANGGAVAHMLSGEAIDARNGTHFQRGE